MGMETAPLGTPENRLTAIVTLAAAVDGVDIVVGAHEGLVYSVEAPNPDMQPYAEELASLSAGYVETVTSRALAGKASVIVASHRDKSLLVADIGEGYTVAILGEPSAISALLAPVRRIVEGKPLQCPKCGALLEVFTQTCPRCGRRVPFGVASCPFCGADLSAKTCPNCGTRLRLVEERLEPIEAEAAKEAAATPRPEQEKAVAAEAPRLPLGIGLGAATLGAVVYFLAAALFKFPMGEAAVAGALPIAVSYALAIAKSK